MPPLSFEDSLHQVLPDCYNRLHDSISTTYSDARVEPNRVEDWDIIPELNDFFDDFRVDNSLRFEAMRQNQSDFHDEVDVQAQLRQTLLKTVELLMNGTHSRPISITTKGAVPGTREVVFDPDMIAWRQQQRIPGLRLLAPIEIKKPHEADTDDLRALYRRRSTRNAKVTRARKIIQQEVGYLDRNCCEYGIITTYVSTYAVKMDGHTNVVHISRPFRYNETQPTVIKLVYYILCKALESNGLPGKAMTAVVPSSNKKRKQRETYSPSDSNSDVSPWDLQEKVPLKSRKGNRVFLCPYKGYAVILKQASVSRDERLLRETHMYQHMRQLQGVVIPKILSSGVQDGKRYLIMEDCGNPIDPSMYGKMSRAVARAIDRIHSLRVCHGDLELRNIVTNGSQVYIIDFEDAYVTSNISDLQTEKAILMNKLSPA